ncbi:hypothetical protein GQ53DRAFT_183501 [Thozetella sp. PMI_491]|nr:hypothetical protein GQ53DRAFT_183501 [Thozetella sp. PMI_491]
MLKLTPGDHESFKRLLHVTVSENPATASENTPDYLHEEAELIARGLKAYVDRSVGLYISSLISKLDDVIWRTYLIAYKHVTDAQTSRERALMINTFRLWITCINSNRELDVVVDNRFDDKYGPATVARASERHGPDVVVRHDLFSQLRVVLRQKLLCPWSKAIMTELDALIRSGKREYWFTIYLVSFILLHGAAMLTEADHELAGRVGISGDYARPMTILKYHEGMRTLLAYYHLSDQTFRPFQLALSAQGLESLAQTAGLNPDQAEHVRWTANAMKEREQTNRRSREERQYADPYYWISQLFDDRRI